MLIAVEQKPCPCRTAMPHSPQHFQADQFVEPIRGINKCCQDRICFLGQEPCGIQCRQGPLSLSIYLLAFLKIHLHHHLLVHFRLLPRRLKCYPLSCLLFFLRLILRHIIRFVLYSNPHCTFSLPWPHGVGCSLYAGRMARAKMEISTRRLCLAHCFPHNEFSKGPAERLPDSHRERPGRFI